MPVRVLLIGLVVGLAGLVLGGMILGAASTDRVLFAGSAISAGGAIFFGYSIFAFVWWRRSLKKSA